MWQRVTSQFSIIVITMFFLHPIYNRAMLEASINNNNMKYYSRSYHPPPKVLTKTATMIGKSNY